MSAVSKRLSLVAFVGCLIALGMFSASIAAAGEFDQFGIESVGASESSSKAGLHPDVRTEIVLNHELEEEEGILHESVPAVAEDISLALPPGLVGNLNSVETCSTGQFGAFGNCPWRSQIGIVKVQLTGRPFMTEPLFNLEPPHGDQVARFGFYAAVYPTFVDIKVRTGSDYGVTATVSGATGIEPFVKAETIIWGVPADPVHDEQRLAPFEALFCYETGNACFTPEGRRSVGPPLLPFLSNPTACEDQDVGFTVTSYQLPGSIFTADAPLPPITDCDKPPFEPSMQIEPTSHEAGAPTGLKAVLKIPQNEAVNLPATSAMRAAKVTLPDGMSINSSAADGLEACSEEQVALGREVGSNCPEGAKLGTAEIVSPALPEPLHGEVYQRTPAPGNLFRVWLVTDELGLHLKLPGDIRTNQATGQLTVEFNDTPQLPVEEIALEFKDGPRAPLVNPATCGEYSAAYMLTPWADAPPVTGHTQAMHIDQGCGGGFSPTLEAGVVNPVAGAYSHFVMDLKRGDGEGNFSSLDLVLPKGELAKLKSVPLCSDAAAAEGSCAPGSQIGSAAVAAGAGQPLWIPQPGKAPTGVFLGGPYKGAPYSVVTEVPAQAGPFDLGTVAVRAGLYVDPETAQATVKTDPLPQILEGVPVLYRTIRVSIDRDKFTINPTNCRKQVVEAAVTSTDGVIAHPVDRFQVGECAALKFGPALKLRLKGGARRGQYPALTATLTMHKGEANIRKASVALPHSEFLAQEHIGTVCTRVQFAGGDCPEGSVYGRARAITPLLGKPLEGPVYLRSSDNPLPDLVAELDGQIRINLVGRIDSVDGGIRTTFQTVPDAPVRNFILKMRGGKRGLLVNSTDICAVRKRAVAKMAGQNGKIHELHPLLSIRCKAGDHS